jgi:hypothetical protein
MEVEDQSSHSDKPQATGIETEVADANQFLNACSTLYTGKTVNFSAETISGNPLIQKTRN